MDIFRYFYRKHNCADPRRACNSLCPVPIEPRRVNAVDKAVVRHHIVGINAVAVSVLNDLRTPLTMVKAYAEMIRDLSGDNPAKRSLGSARSPRTITNSIVSVLNRGFLTSAYASYILTGWSQDEFTTDNLDLLAYDNDMCILIQEIFAIRSRRRESTFDISAAA